MPARQSVLCAAALACAAWAALAPAAAAFGYDLERRFCGSDAFHTDVSPPPIMLGCRVPGCCPGPGCSADAALDLAVDVEGDLPVSLKATIDGVPALTAQFPLGRTVIKGVAAAAAGSPAQSPAASARPRLLRVEASLDAGAVEQAARAVAPRSFNGGKVARLAVSFTQLQGERVVAVDRYSAAVTSCPIQRPLTDRIELTGNDGNDEAVVIVRGVRDGACVSGEIWLGKHLIYIGNLDSGHGCPADLAVFSRDHAAVLRSIGGLAPAGSSASAAASRASPNQAAAPPQIVVGQQVGPQGWTRGVGERLEVSLAAARVVLPLAVRLVAAAPEVEALRARSRFDLAVADRALNLSRCGIAVASGADVATTQLDDTVRGELLAAAEASEAERCDRVAAVLERQGPRTPGKVVEAVYLAEAAVAVFSCREQGVVVLGGLAGPESLVHGLGHLLGLEHSEVVAAAAGNVAGGVAQTDLPPLGSDNLMRPQGAVRRFFTVGQCFVAAFDPRSLLNDWKLRAGPIRACGPGAVPDSCPPIGFNAGAQ